MLVSPGDPNSPVILLVSGEAGAWPYAALPAGEPSITSFKGIGSKGSDPLVSGGVIAICSDWSQSHSTPFTTQRRHGFSSLHRR